MPATAPADAEAEDEEDVAEPAAQVQGQDAPQGNREAAVVGNDGDDDAAPKQEKQGFFAPIAALAGFGGKKEEEEKEEKEAKPERKQKEKAKRDLAPAADGDRRRNYAQRSKHPAVAAAPVYDGDTDAPADESGAAATEDIEDEPEAVHDQDDEDEGNAEADEADEEPATRDSHRGAATTGAAATAAAGAAGAGAAAAGASRRPDDLKLEKKGRVYPLTGIDNVALLMEDDGYQTACFSVYLFKTKLDYDTVVDFFERLTDAYPKYRYVCELDPSAAAKKDKAAQKGEPPEPRGVDPGRKTKYSKSLKAGSPFRPARWRIDETFKLTDNIRTVRADSPGDDQSLFDICGQCLSEHFDFNKPLWEAVLVHGLHTSEGARSALMIKIHHAFSDGQGMIQSYHSAIEAMQTGVSVANKQAEIDNKVAAASSRAKDSEKHQSEQKNIGSRNVKPSVGSTISHIGHTIRGLYFRNRKTFTYSDAAGKEAAKLYGAKLSKNNRPSTRFYAHSEGIAMADIKLVRQAFSTEKINLSLNDVACAILSRALRIAAEVMAEKEGVNKKKRVTDKRVAVFIPVSKRPKGDWSLANYTTGTVAWFRFHEPSQYGFEQLLMQVNREMNRIKSSHLPTIWYRVFNSVCKRRFWQFPNYPGFRAFFQAAYQEYHVFTNVPGPSKPVSFGKHEAFSYHVLPPSSPGKSTMAMGAISYANDFSLAVSCDGIKRFQDHALPVTICAAFQQASEELVSAAKSKLGKA